MLAQVVLVFGLFDLVQIVQEKHGIFSAIVGPREDIPGYARRAAILNILVAKENVDAAVFESDGLLQALSM